MAAVGAVRRGRERHEYTRWLADFFIVHVLPCSPSVDASDYCALAEAFYPLLPINYLWARSTTNVSLGRAFERVSFGDQRKALHSSDIWHRADELNKVAETVELIAAARGCQRVVETIHRRHYRSELSFLSASSFMTRACASEHCSKYGLEILWQWFRQKTDLHDAFCERENFERKCPATIAELFRTPDRMEWLLGKTDFDPTEEIKSASGDLLLEAVSRGLVSSVRPFLDDRYGELISAPKVRWFCKTFAKHLRNT